MKNKKLLIIILSFSLPSLIKALILKSSIIKNLALHKSIIVPPQKIYDWESYINSLEHKKKLQNQLTLNLQKIYFEKTINYEKKKNLQEKNKKIIEYINNIEESTYKFENYSKNEKENPFRYFLLTIYWGLMTHMSTNLIYTIFK
jgi:hypothetical protein